MLYPVNMNQHGPARSIEDYLGWLREELRQERTWARRRDLDARIRMLEDELGAREPL